LDKKIL